MPDSNLLRYRCNVCGHPNEVPREGFDREKPSCGKCGSTVRLRALAMLIAEQLTGTSLALPDLPVLRSLEGVGMSDPDFLAAALEPKFRYVNTFYHKPPLFDVLHPAADQLGRYDFIVSSEVLEHVPDPVGPAFENLARMLKPNGVLLLTTPYRLGKQTEEHFPGLHDFAVVDLNGHWVLVDRRPDGRIETHEDLVFHGGDGSTLEMRVFAEDELKRLLAAAGFTDVRIAGGSYPEFGIFQTEPWSLPIAARKAPAAAPTLENFRDLAGAYAETRVKYNNAAKDLQALKHEYETHVAWAEQKVGQLEVDLAQRLAWGQKSEREFEERTEWALRLRQELEEAQEQLEAQEAELEKRTHWALGLQAELDRAAEEKRQLENSGRFRLARRLFRF